MQLILEFDDLHWKTPQDCMLTIDKLVQAVPFIKLSFFTTPHHSFIPIHSNPIWCMKLREHIENGNVQLAMHGLTHSHLEFNI